MKKLILIFFLGIISLALKAQTVVYGEPEKPLIMGDSVKRYMLSDTIDVVYLVSYCGRCATFTRTGYMTLSGKAYYRSTALFDRNKYFPIPSRWIVWSYKVKKYRYKLIP